MNRKKSQSKASFKWNVFVWNVNRDELETYDVVPTFVREFKLLKKNEKPKTKKELSDFLDRWARYYFWAKCEYEVIVQSWPKFKNEEKVDVYQQLHLNWDAFVDAFCDNFGI